LTYKVEYSDDAVDFLEKLAKRNPTDAKRIYNWIGKNLEGCEEPRRFGRALSGNLRGSWRYRIGDFRILTEIHDDVLLIFIFEIGKRDSIYD
jgi:mRNA interferase RelE/StbE